MDKLAKYRQLVQDALLVYGKQKSGYGDVEIQTIARSNS